MSFGLDMIGARDDPFAQPRAARRLPLLLHSMTVFREVFEVIFANRSITTVVEVGVESGRVSSVYTELGASTVYCVDPNPTEQLRAALAENPALKLVETPSPQVLAELPPADLYVLDGDHNYAIVRGELDWIMKNVPDAVVVLHDVMWPCSRRDLYYQPTTLSPEQMHPARDDGPTVWHDDLTPAGLVGLGAFTMAVEAGGERNGILTAIEDALAEAGNAWSFSLVPAVFGMGLVMRKASAGAKKITDVLRPLVESRLLAILENNRIALYTRVLQMQYEAVAHADDADRLAETIAAQRRQIERHDAETRALREEKEQLEREVAELVATNPRLGAVIVKIGRVAAKQVRKTLN